MRILGLTSFQKRGRGTSHFQAWSIRAAQARARSLCGHKLAPEDVERRDAKLERIECGYLARGTGRRDATAPLQSACAIYTVSRSIVDQAVHQRDSGSGHLTVAKITVVPAGETVEPDAKWALAQKHLGRPFSGPEPPKDGPRRAQRARDRWSAPAAPAIFISVGSGGQISHEAYSTLHSEISADPRRHVYVYLFRKNILKYKWHAACGAVLPLERMESAMPSVNVSSIASRTMFHTTRLATQSAEDALASVRRRLDDLLQLWQRDTEERAAVDVGIEADEFSSLEMKEYLRPSTLMIVVAADVHGLLARARDACTLPKPRAHFLVDELHHLARVVGATETSSHPLRAVDLLGVVEVFWRGKLAATLVVNRALGLNVAEIPYRRAEIEAGTITVRIHRIAGDPIEVVVLHRAPDLSELETNAGVLVPSTSIEIDIRPSAFIGAIGRAFGAIGRGVAQVAQKAVEGAAAGAAGAIVATKVAARDVGQAAEKAAPAVEDATEVAEAAGALKDLVIHGARRGRMVIGENHSVAALLQFRRNLLVENRKTRR